MRIDQNIETGLVIPPRQVTRALTWTGDTEWNTPSNIIVASGGIDVDPASSDAQQERAPVKAATYYTVENSGLDKPWNGRVFLNPPYARGWIDRFVAKMVAAYQTGEMQQGIMLTNSATETKWWQHAGKHCSALCFYKGRVRFLRIVDGALTRGKSSPSHPHTIFYFGNDVARFARVFATMGLVFPPPVLAITGMTPSHEGDAG